MPKKPTIDDPSMGPTLEEELAAKADRADEVLVAEKEPEPEKKPEPKPGSAKKSEPKAGDVAYDWSHHYPEGVDLYTHTYPNGTVVALRRFKDIYSKQWLRSIRNLETDFDIQNAAIDRAACETAQEVIDAVPCPIGEPDQFDALFEAWQKADLDESVTPGE